MDTYHYELNLQGDVIAILDSSGNRVVEYTYDAWGKLLSISGSMKDSLGKANPLRYRGYVYDDETGLYYCQSRYYDPQTHRFLNADALVSTGQGMLGNNMFAYCRNNPVCRIDISGTADYISYNDGELLSNDELDCRGQGGGSTSIYNESFKSYQINSTNLNAESSINLPAGKGFQNFSQLKSYLGPADEGYHWHHIVEQSQIARSGFSPEQIHNTSNVIQVQAATHAQITGHYNTTTFPYTNGLSVRNWLAGQPFAVQYEYGIDVLRQFGVIS